MEDNTPAPEEYTLDLEKSRDLLILLQIKILFRDMAENKHLQERLQNPSARLSTIFEDLVFAELDLQLWRLTSGLEAFGFAEKHQLPQHYIDRIAKAQQEFPPENTWLSQNIGKPCSSRDFVEGYREICPALCEELLPHVSAKIPTGPL